MTKYLPIFSILFFILALALFVGCDDNECHSNYKVTNKNSKVKINWQEKVFIEEFGPCYVFSKIEIDNKEYMLIYNRYSPKHFKIIEVKP